MVIRVDDPVHRMEIACDRPNCAYAIRLTRPTRDECNLHIYKAGWRLYRGKQLCPYHAEKVMRRPRRAR